MSSEPTSESATVNQVPALDATPADDAQAQPRGVLVARGTLYFFLALSAVALAASGMLWQKLSNIQEQLARQSADAGQHAGEHQGLVRLGIVGVVDGADQVRALL